MQFPASNDEKYNIYEKYEQCLYLWKIFLKLLDQLSIYQKLFYRR